MGIVPRYIYIYMCVCVLPTKWNISGIGTSKELFMNPAVLSFSNIFKSSQALMSEAAILNR